MDEERGGEEKEGRGRRRIEEMGRLRSGSIDL